MIELHPIQEEHAGTVLRWRRQPSTIKHNPVKNFSLEELKIHINREESDLSNLNEKSSYRWIALKNKILVGNASLKNINLMMNYAEIGYGVGEEFQGQGYGSIIVESLVEMVFEKTPIRKLMAYVHDKNIPSCKILDKIGFRREGLLREHYIINGKPENEILFGSLKHEFMKMRTL
ncbi:MAG: GNAT family N-acetyltransferase [Pseudobdellovibrionaceae bacterium]|nr:MAG: GNAT family N-acetyltransferase [Pseudobdellovibrionaceae bacterium]